MHRLLLCLILLGGSLTLAAQSVPPPAPKPAAPTVTQEKLESRLAELQKAHDQVLANLNALEGAIQETQHWLLELKSPPPEQKPVSPAPPKK
jgi:TolA-binding protein